MLDPTKTRFWKAAIQSGLLEADDLAACWELIPPEKRDEEDHIDRRLGRQAVHLKRLTLWQAQQLLAGRFSGFKVDRYVLMDLIGQGGMGRVYLASDSRLNRRVALKILSPERMKNPRAIARFQREARVGAQLQHENLVRLYDFGESQGRHFLVMEYIEGRTLGFHIATQGKIAPGAAAQAARQVALGLEHAHQKGLIHRDVNPYNVIVTHDGVAKLTDMGLAMDMAEEAKVTRDGATVGTFDYVAPEQARHSHAADIRSDVYSLGCTLYHAIAGRVPFPQPGLAEKLFAHQSQEPDPLEKLTPEVPIGLADVVRRMMQKVPADRYQTPGEVAAALQPFITGADAAVAVGGGEAPPPRGGGMTPRTSTAGSDAESEAADPFPFKLDLGPEPSLSDSIRPAKTWFGGSSSRPSMSNGSNSGPSTETSATSIALEPTRLRLMIAALVLGLLAFGTTFEVVRRGRSQLVPTGSGDPKQVDGRGSPPVVVESAAPAIDWGDASVVLRDRDGTIRPASDLPSAMELAMGGRGVVVVKGGEPLTVKADAGRLLSGRGTVELIGEPGGKSVLRVESGSGPWLSTGSSVNLVLRDLTIEIVAPATAERPPAPVILAAGRATIDRCAFRTDPILGYPGALAVSSRGGRLEVDSCWFEGFDAAVEIRALAGVEHRFRETMFVPGGTPVEAGRANVPVRRGWAVRVAFEGGGARDGRRAVDLDHCTIVGEGVLRMEGFTESSPLGVDASSCVAKVERLLDASPAPWTPRALIWKGNGNRLDVAGDSWTTGAASESPIADAGAWAERYAEKGLEDAGVRFTMRSSPDAVRLTPDSYSLLDASDPPRGADPAAVGPRP